MIYPGTLKRGMDEMDKKKKPEGPTAIEKENLNKLGPEGDRARAREQSQQATGAARLQESEANKGAYGGLGLSERAEAERMVRSGQAKTRDEAAAKIRARKKPKASTQAGALEK